MHEAYQPVTMPDRQMLFDTEQNSGPLPQETKRNETKRNETKRNETKRSAGLACASLSFSLSYTTWVRSGQVGSVRSKPSLIRRVSLIMPLATPQNLLARTYCVVVVVGSITTPPHPAPFLHLTHKHKHKHKKAHSVTEPISPFP